MLELLEFFIPIYAGANFIFIVILDVESDLKILNAFILVLGIVHAALPMDFIN